MLVNRLLGRIKNDLSLTDEKAWDRSFWNLLSSRSDSGVHVDETNALTFAPVFCAINLISGATSTLPLRLFVKKNKKRTVATEKTSNKVMNYRWNQYMTAQIGREVMIAHILAWGNGYAEKVYNKMGDLVELWPIPPNRVMPEMYEGELTYRIKVGSEEIRLKRDKILHIPGLGFDGFTGYSVISLARQSIGLGMAMEEFGARFFGSGTHPGVVVTHPNKLSPQAHANLTGSLDKGFQGLGKSHRLLFLEEGMKLEKLGIPPEDAQFLESRQHQIPEIARWFNLPPHKLKDLTKSSFSNIESEQISFVTESILPWLIRLETNYNMQLLSEREQDQGYYFKHNVAGLLRGDATSRGEFYSKLFNIGVVSINDIRELEDWDPVDGGDIHLVPLNMIPLDQVGKEVKNDIKQTQPIEPVKE